MMTAALVPARPARRGHVARRALIACLAALLTFVGVTAFDATAAHAEDTVGISGVPAGGDGGADGRTRFSYAADPGQQVADNYLVRNAGTTTQTFTVLATDAFNDEAGEFALLETGQQPTDVGSWVQFENGTNRLQFDLAPGEQRVVPFAVVIPADATPGDHAGGVMASVVTSGQQMNLDRRIGTRLYLRVSGDLQPGLSIAGLSASYVGDWWNPLNGAVRLHYTIENTGNIALASNISVGTRTWFGIPVGSEQGDGIPELLPGNTRTYETDLPGIASLGYLNPWVNLHPFVAGDDEAKQMGVNPTERDTMLIAPPWILVIAIVLIAMFLLFRRWRGRVDARRAAEWIEYTEAEARRKAETEREAVGAGSGGSAR